VRVYLDGAFLPLEEAHVSVEDRGFLFGDGVYEVVKFVAGRAFEMERHRERLAQGLAQIEISFETETFPRIADRLIRDNGLTDGFATVYIQVTRGVSPRRHPFPPAGTRPTVFAQAHRLVPPTAEQERGVAIVLEPDERWARCDIKSINLLPNVLAAERARRAGAFEAALVRDGRILECSHSGFFAVVGGILRTAPKSPHILPSVTREVILDLARELGMPPRQDAVAVDELDAAQEVFLASTTADVMPVVSIGGRSVGSGSPGPITRRLQEAFARRLARPTTSH
jgi:D-alanine transaminase